MIRPGGWGGRHRLRQDPQHYEWLAATPPPAVPLSAAAGLYEYAAAVPAEYRSPRTDGRARVGDAARAVCVTRQRSSYLTDAVERWARADCWQEAAASL